MSKRACCIVARPDASKNADVSVEGLGKGVRIHVECLLHLAYGGCWVTPHDSLARWQCQQGVCERESERQRERDREILSLQIAQLQENMTHKPQKVSWHTIARGVNRKEFFAGRRKARRLRILQETLLMFCFSRTAPSRSVLSQFLFSSCNECEFIQTLPIRTCFCLGKLHAEK